MSTGLKANSDGSAAIQVGGTDVITLTSGGAATFVTSPTTVQAGTAAAPSITFSGDTNTGIYSPGADTIAFTEGGVESMRLNSSGNVGFASTPLGWWATGVIQGRSYAILEGTGVDATSWVTGAYQTTYNGSWLSRGAYRATLYEQRTGAHNFWTSSATPSGAGQTISFNQSMTLTNDPCLVLTRPFANNTAQLQVLNTAVAQKAAVYDVGLFQSDDAPTIRITEVNPSTSAVISEMTLCGGDLNLQVIGATGSLVFATNRAAGTQGYQVTGERARITSSDLQLSAVRIVISGASGIPQPVNNGDGNIGTATTNGLALIGKGSTNDIIFLNKDGNTAGRVATGATTITTSSDERLKENLVPIENAVDKVAQLRTVTGNYKSDPSRNVAFLIAQDVDAVFPQAVEKGDPEELGINYNWVIPLALAAIKEQQAMIDELKAKVAALEGA